MAVANLIDDRKEIITGNDNIVIVDIFQSIRGGRTLDVTGYPKDVLNAGHVIIVETATKEYKPMPLDTAGTAYDALPAGHEYAGILIATILKKRPFAVCFFKQIGFEQPFSVFGHFGGFPHLFHRLHRR